jgi:hypothetical protein
MLPMSSLREMALSMRSRLALSNIDVHVTLLVGMWLRRMIMGMAMRTAAPLAFGWCLVGVMALHFN